MNQLVNLFHQYWAYILPFIVAYGLNLLFGHRSQVDSWCNANPKRAAVLKFIRGVLPIDPWLIVQSISLLFKGKLPVKLQTILTTVEAVTDNKPEEKEPVKEDSPEPPATA